MAFTEVPVVGHYRLGESAVPATGSVSFRPVVSMANGSDLVVAAKREVRLVNGSIPSGFTLAATDDVGTTPTGNTYAVMESIGGTFASYFIAVPKASSQIDLATVDRLEVVTDVTAYERITQKGVAGGYAPLDSSSAVPTANLPSKLYSDSAVFLTAVGDGTADDTASINAQLAAGVAGSHFRGKPGKNYKISSPLLLRSGGQQTLDMTGCTVTLASGSNCNMLRNSAATALRTLTGAATTASSTTVTASGGDFTSGDIGRTVAVRAAGTVAALAYGVITAVASTTSITISVAANTTGSGNLIDVFTADTNITVIGGTWARGSNAGSFTGLHSLLLRRVTGLRIADVTVSSSAGKYAIALGDVTNATVERCTFAVASDGVHVNGPATSVRIATIRGTSGDDAVAFTGNDFAAYADVVGNITDALAEDVLVASATACVKLTAGASTVVSNVTARKFRNLSATVVTAWSLADDTGTLNLKNILFEDFVGSGLSATGTVERLVLRNCAYVPIVNSGTMVNILGTTIGELIVENARINQATYTANHMVNVTTSATITRVVIDRCELVASAAYFLVSAVVGNAITTVVIAKCRKDGISSSGGLVQAAFGGTLTAVFVSDTLALNNAWIADTAATTVFTLTGVSCQSLFNIRATGAVTVRGSGLVSTNNTVAITTGGTLASKSRDLRIDVSKLTQTAGDEANNVNSALSVPTGPVISDGTNWLPVGRAFASGTVSLVAGTATVANTNITTSSRIRLTTLANGGTVGHPYVSARTASTSFTITSTSGTDTSSIFWELVQP
jgi:hypothetical protein